MSNSLAVGILPPPSTKGVIIKDVVKPANKVSDVATLVQGKWWLFILFVLMIPLMMRLGISYLESLPLFLLFRGRL